MSARRLALAAAVALPVAMCTHLAATARAEGDPAPTASSPDPSAPPAAPSATPGVAAPAPAALSDLELYDKGRTAFTNGELGAAIVAFEALADRGFLHPAASYARGVAYAARVRSPAEKPGDLGRAAAAFEETLQLDPSHRDADRLLDEVRAEVTRRRSRSGNPTVDVRPTLDRVIAGLASDRVWTIASIVASFLLAIGLVLRRFDSVPAAPTAEADPRFVAATSETGVAAKKAGPAHPVHVAGSVLVAVGLVALLALVPIAVHARSLRASTHAGVVVVSEAHFTDESGRAAGGDPVPEAAAVEVGERRGTMLHVRWGATEGWLPATAVRVLP